MTACILRNESEARVFYTKRFSTSSRSSTELRVDAKLQNAGVASLNIMKKILKYYVAQLTVAVQLDSSGNGQSVGRAYN